MDELFKDAAGIILTKDAWPFWSTVLVFTVIGQFTSTKVFTRARAHKEWGSWWANAILWWGRESLMLHPIAAGAVLALFWRDPQGIGWPLVGSMMYFASAGVVSLGAWMTIKGFAKRKGIDLKFPGETLPPG